MSTRSEQALLMRNLNTLRHWVERTQWERKSWAKGVDREKIKREMQVYTRDLGDRCQYNLGWHAAQQGDGLEDYNSTANLNLELSGLIKVIETHGKVERGRGKPKKTFLSKADQAVVDKWSDDPTGRGLDHFIADAMEAGSLSSSKEPEAHRRRIDRALNRAINAGNLEATKYRRRGLLIDPSKLSMEEYVAWCEAGRPVLQSKLKK